MDDPRPTKDADERAMADALVRHGVVTERQLAECEASCSGPDGPKSLLEALLARGYLRPDELAAFEHRTLAADGPPRPSGQPVLPTIAGPAPPRAVAETTPAASPPDEPPSEAARRKFGPFELVQELGRGGMGVVYKAWDPRLSRFVALKVLGSLAAVDDTLVARFQREAKTAAGLRHPAIVQVHEVGEVDGDHYIAMEYIEGTTLRRHLAERKGFADLLGTTRLISTVAGALAHAHENGVIHRDVKPENIFIDSSGRAFIGDFGLAREVQGETRLTISGILLGTPSYMAPEQAQGDQNETGTWTDVYQIGAVLYEVLTGRPPFAAGQLAELFYKILYEEAIPPSKIDSRLPRDLEVICLKCIEKDRGRRYANARELVDDLGRFFNGEPILARAPSMAYVLWRRVVRRKALSAALAGVLLTTAIGSSLGISAVLSKRKEQHAVDLLSREREAMRILGDADAAMEPLENWGREEGVDPVALQDARQTVEDLLARAGQLLPGRAEPIVARARLLLCLGIEGEALRELDRAVALGGASLPDYQDARGWALVRVYARTKREPEVRMKSRPGGGAPEPLLEDPPPDSDAQAALASKARLALQQALSGGGDRRRRLRSQVALPFLEGKYAEAEEAYAAAAREDESIRFDRETVWTAVRAAYYRAAGDPGARAEALARAREMLASAERGLGAREEYWELRARVEHALGRLDEAIELAERGIAVGAGRGRTPVLLATLLLHKGDTARGRGEDPRASYQAALGAVESVVPAPELAGGAENLRGLVFRRLAELKADRGEDPSWETERAERAFDRAIELDPAMAAAANNIGNLHVWKARRLASTGADPLSEYQAARRACERALSLQPNLAGVEANLAAILMETGDWRSSRGIDPVADYTEGLSICDSAAERGRVPIEVRFQQALLRWRLADWDRAHGGEASTYQDVLSSFDVVLAMEPGHADALVGRARALERLGRDAEALATYESALRAGARREEVRERMEEIGQRIAKGTAGGLEDARLSRIASLSRADRMARSGKPGEARQEYLKALALFGPAEALGASDRAQLSHVRFALASCCAGMIVGAQTEPSSAAVRDEAFTHLRAAVELGLKDRAVFEGEEALAPLHGDTRWEAFLASLAR